MSDPVLHQMLQTVAAGSPVAAFLVYAVWYLVRQQNRWIERLDNERKDRLELLEKHIEACDQDRQRLNAALLDMQKQSAGRRSR